MTEESEQEKGYRSALARIEEVGLIDAKIEQALRMSLAARFGPPSAPLVIAYWRGYERGLSEVKSP